jgi:hypothetical protein
LRGPPERWAAAVALFHVPFDESGKSADSSHVVFGGFVAEPNRWHEFGREWGAKLRANGLTFFRATDAFTFGNEWKRFGGNDPVKEKERDELVHALASIGCQFGRQGTGAVITTVSFAGLPAVKRRPYRDDAFYLPFESGIKGLLHCPFAEPRDEFTLICDDSDEYSGESLNAYRRFIRDDADLSGRVSGICFLDDKKYPPLQFADMWAYCLRRNAAGASTGLWREIYDKLLAVFSDVITDDVIR